MPASGVGPVKRLILSLDAREAETAVARMMRYDMPTIRGELTEFAVAQGYAL
jgi:signal transduction protein with GAF and PtsI domain